MEKSEDEIVRMPMWKSYLYHLQQQAPQPKRIVCQREVPNKPPFYGREYHGAISREEADFLLTIGGEGSYLIRESQRAPGQYTLAIRFDAITKNFKLYYDGQHYVGEKRFDTIQDLVADGLITFYLESKAADYIASLSNQTNYAESPYVAYNTQKRRHMNSKSHKRRSSKRRSKAEGDGKHHHHHHHHHHRAKNEVGPPMLHHQVKDDGKKKEAGKEGGEKGSPVKKTADKSEDVSEKELKESPAKKNDVPDNRAVDDDDDDIDGDHDYINQPHYPSRPNQNRASQASHAPPKPTPRTSRQSTKQGSPQLKSDEEPLPPPPPSPEQTLKPSDEPLPPPPPSPPDAQPASQTAASQPAAKPSAQPQRSLEDNAQGPSEPSKGSPGASKGSPGASEATKGASASAAVAKPNSEAAKPSQVSDITRGSPGVSDVTKVSDVTRGSPGVSDVTRGSPGVSDVTRKSPAVSDGARAAVSEVTRRSPGVSEAAHNTPRVTSSTNTDGPCRHHQSNSSSERRSPSPRTKSKPSYKMWEDIVRATPPGSPALHLFDPDRGSGGGHKPSSVAWCTDYLEVMGCEKPHNFKLHTFKGPHWCDFCANFLWGLIAQGVKCQDCGFNAHKKCSEKVPPDCMPDMRYVKRMFGVDLTTLVKAQNTLIPAVVETCIKEIEKRGLESEGLYRVAGFHDDIEAIKISFDKDGDLTDISEDRYEDLNTITSVLKLYFRLLPIPLLTFDIYFKVIDIIKREELGLDNKLNALQHALAQLPPAHYHTLKYLMAHLHRVTDKCQQNKMHSDNLAMVFSPTLLRSPDTDPLASLTAVKFERELIEVLITHQSFLFE